MTTGNDCQFCSGEVRDVSRCRIIPKCAYVIFYESEDNKEE